MRLRLFPILALAGSLSACASYHPAPLARRAVLARDVAALSVPTASLPFATLRRHRFDPADGLDMTEVAMLAVARDPDLVLARDQAGVRAAQAFAAGLLPNPQFGFGLDHPTNPGPGNMNGFSFGLSQDVSALLTSGLRRAAARAEGRQTRLDLLWREWQVVGQARLAFTKTVYLTRELALLDRETKAFARRYHALAAQEAAGDATAGEADGALSALSGVEARQSAARRALLAAWADLDGLMGLAPSARPRLAGGAELAAPDPDRVRAALADLARRRPDLRALQAGYRAQEAKSRLAVLSQFPALGLGIARARDTSGLYTDGLSITLSLPLFDHGQGRIMTARATRKALRDAYRVRLDRAAAQVATLTQDAGLIEARLGQIRALLPRLDQARRYAARALAQGDMTQPAFAEIEAAWLDLKLEDLDLARSLTESRIGLETLLGPDLAPTRKKA